MNTGGVSGAIAKTATAPIERVKLIIQTQGFQIQYALFEPSSIPI